MIKRSRGKKQREELEKKQHVVVTENILFKGFATEGVRNYDQKPANFTVTVDCAANLQARNLPQREKFHTTPLLSLTDYFSL